MNKVFRIKHRIGHRLKAHHRGGHGIHSPFLFHLINAVIENKHAYYAYHDLKTTYQGNPSTIKHKFLLLLFRLANSFACNNILLLGKQGNLAEPYFRKARINATIQLTETPDDDSEITPDFIFLNASLSSEWINYIEKKRSQACCIAVWGIHHNAESLALWNRYTKNWTHSIDFYHLGFLFNKEEVPAQKFKY